MSLLPFACPIAHPASSSTAKKVFIGSSPRTPPIVPCILRGGKRFGLAWNCNRETQCFPTGERCNYRRCLWFFEFCDIDKFNDDFLPIVCLVRAVRSEERRVGKEC